MGQEETVQSGEPLQQQGYYRSMESKNPGVAAVLALVLGFFCLWGIGHLYVGKINKGILLLFLGIVMIFLSILFLFPFFIGLIVWIWQTYDAHRLAKEFNRAVETTGRAPW